MSKLNAKLVTHTAPKSSEYRLADGNGLFLRIRTSGSKSWLYCFRLPGSRSLLQMTLGSIADVSLKEARDILPELRKLVAKGIDPRNARAAAKTENAQAMTMQALFDAWIEFVKLTEKVTPAWIKRHEDRWRLHLKKLLGNILARDVTRAHLAAALDAMSRQGIREETRKALTTLNLMLDYGLTRHIVEQSPARMLKPKDFAATASKPRNCVLTLAELRSLWHALDAATTSAMSPITATAIKLLILTGARRSEVAGMRWDEVDFNTGTWMLAAERTKNRQAHTIYLGKFALQLIKELQLLTGQSKFVFNTGLNTDHIHVDSLNTALARLRTKLKNNNNEYSIAKFFTIHDLRRTAATMWGEYLKAKPHIVERMLNHQPLNKLIATYQRATYAVEQKTAWVTWDEMVNYQIDSDIKNVVAIKKSVVI